MHVLSEFYLSYDTLLFYPRYDRFGNLLTVAIENQGSVLVDMEPSKLIDFNLNYYGSSLEGARAGAKAVLGNVKKPPIVVSERYGIYWFPTKSPNKEDCAWIALHHVQDYTSSEKGKTEVVFTNDHSLDVDISLYSFEKSMQRAYALKGKVENRMKRLENLTVKQEQLLYVSEERSGYGFVMNSRNRGEQMEFNLDMRK